MRTRGTWKTWLHPGIAALPAYNITITPGFYNIPTWLNPKRRKTCITTRFQVLSFELLNDV